MGGDPAAWRELVRRFGGVVWTIARSHRLSLHDTQDVSQTTWLQLAIHIQSLNDRGAVGAWLATTARRESLRVIRRRNRETPWDPGESWINSVPDSSDPIDEMASRAEQRSKVAAGFGALDDDCKLLLGLLIQEPPLSYIEISKALGIPRGSIGPLRGRCLRKLRKISGL